MKIPLGPLAELLGGELTDASRAGVVVSNIRSLDDAGPGDLAFLWRPDYEETARTSRAGAIVARDPIEGVTCILVPDPQAAMLAILGQVYGRRHPSPAEGVHPDSSVHTTAKLGQGVSVGPGAVVEAGAHVGAQTQIRARAYVGREVQLGSGCVIHPNATVLDHCRLGDRVVIHSGSVIGKDGFGFVQREDGRHDRVPQVGGVVVGDDVEVGALSTVARGAIEDTQIGDGTKIDDHCHVAHGCRLGENVLLIGGTRLGGSVEIGDNAFLLQESAVSVGRKVGAGAILGSGARVLYEDVAPGERVAGMPARPHMLAKRIEVCLGELPDYRRRLRSLEKRLDASMRPEGGPARQR